jgi:hypothetical protein
MYDTLTPRLRWFEQARLAEAFVASPVNPPKSLLRNCRQVGWALPTEEMPFRRIPKFMDLWLEVKERRGKGAPKNREMKEEPTMLLITKDRLWEPTMFMKTKMLARAGHDPYENKDFMLQLSTGSLLMKNISNHNAPENAARKSFNERSQEVIENKADRFIADCKSQEVHENKGVIFVKPRGY